MKQILGRIAVPLAILAAWVIVFLSIYGTAHAATVGPANIRLVGQGYNETAKVYLDDSATCIAVPGFGGKAARIDFESGASFQGCWKPTTIADIRYAATEFSNGVRLSLPDVQLAAAFEPAGEPIPGPEQPPVFVVGDQVSVEATQGTVVAAFDTLAGEPRYVVETAGGALAIYAPEQLVAQ